MKKIRLIICGLVLATLFGCAPTQTKYQNSQYELFDTVITLTAYSETQENFDTMSKLCFDEFDRLNKLYDIYNSYEGVTNLCDVNKSAAQGQVTVDTDIAELLQFGKQAYALTEGRVNIAFGSVLSLWSQGREQKKAPTLSALAQGAEHCNIEDLKIEGNKVSFADGEMKIDVGAVAKGFATQKVSDLLVSKGYDNFVISAGGNVIAMGKPPNGKKWQVGVQSPDESGNIAAVVEAENQSVVSSGGYLRYFEDNGVKYHHIIDPETLMPADKVGGTTVICANSGVADALSTATFLMTPEQSMELIKTIDNARLIIVTKDGKVLDSADNDPKGN